MCNIYTYYTIKSNLTVDADTFDNLKLTSAYINSSRLPIVIILARTEWQSFSNWDTWVENEMEKISKIAISGELEVLKEGENVTDCPPIKYIITPGHIEKFIAKISFW